MRKENRLVIQFLRFGLVGILCFVIDYGLMVILTELLKVGYFFSSAISFVVSVIVNYLLSMRFVFRGKDDISKTEEIAIFIMLSLIGLAFNQFIMWIAVETFHIFYVAAKVLATIIVSMYNFLSRKIFLE